MASGDIIHQGTLHKLGANVKSWTKRWMILKKDNTLYYYKDPAKSPLGSISLTNHMFLVMEGRERDLNWPKAVGIERTLVIRTSYRIYYMYADTQQEAAKWIEQLQKTADSIPGKKVTKRVEPVAKASGVPIPNGKDHHPKTSSISSSLTASVDTVESIYDAANQPDSDCSISTDEENGPEYSGYAVPPSGEPAREDDIYELADNVPSHSQPSRNSSSKSLTSPVPLPPKQSVSKGGDSGDQPIYEDADVVDANPSDQLVYEEVNDQRPAWAASRHLPPSDPPPPPPDDDDDDEDTVPLPRPPLPPKNSEVPPPVPNRGSATKLANSGNDSPPMVPLKKKAAASSPKVTRADTNEDHGYSQLDKIEKPPMVTSPAILIQKPKIGSKEGTAGTISATEIDTLNYEPVEDSEEFYVDMATTDEAVSENQLNLESQKQKELEEQRQQELEAQRQRHEEAEIQRQKEAEQNQLETAAIQHDETKRLSQVELEAQQQTEYEAKMRREMEEKKKERQDYLANKSKGTPAQLTVEGTKDAKKKRSGTNMFKVQRNRLVESVNTEETNNGKPNTGAWLEIEREKNLMQEEKLKLEREKRQLEEERQKFELEKRRMKMEMARLKQ